METNEFLKAMKFRFACKAFDTQKKIPEEKFETILEAGRLSPSSFGLEPTRLVVIQTPSIREQIKPLCWNQAQITDSSHLVMLTTRVADLHPDSAYITRQFQRRVSDEATLKAYRDERYRGFLVHNDRMDSKSIFNWASRQAYIVGSSMMNAAAFMKIDSCAIEGFEKSKLEQFLGMDTFAEQISLIIAFGYRKEDPKKPSPRLASNDLISYL